MKRCKRIKRKVTITKVRELMRENDIPGTSKVNKNTKYFYLKKVREKVLKDQVKDIPEKEDIDLDRIDDICHIREDDNPYVTGDKELDEAIEAGVMAQRDLCGYPSGIYFCRENLGIPRKKMPQLRGDIFERTSDIRMFLNDLIESGVDVYDEYIEVCRLRSTQKNIEGKKVRRFLETLEKARGNLNRKRTSKYLSKRYLNYLINLGKPIIISRDYYILDGHHRWAAILSWDFIDKKDDELKLNVKMVDLDMAELIDLAIKSKYSKVDVSF